MVAQKRQHRGVNQGSAQARLRNRFGEAGCLLRGPWQGRGRAGTRILLETTPPLLLPGLNPSGHCSFSPGPPAWRERQASGPLGEARHQWGPWYPRRGCQALAALARLPWHRGPRRKTRLRTLATSRGLPGSGFCTVTQICVQRPSALGSVTPGLQGRGSDKTRRLLPAMCHRHGNLRSSSVHNAGMRWLRSLKEG